MAPQAGGCIAKTTPVTADGIYCGASAPVDGTYITQGTMSIVIGTRTDFCNDKLFVQMEWSLTLAGMIGTSQVEMFTCI